MLYYLIALAVIITLRGRLKSCHKWDPQKDISMECKSEETLRPCNYITYAFKCCFAIWCLYFALGNLERYRRNCILLMTRFFCISKKHAYRMFVLSLRFTSSIHIAKDHMLQCFSKHQLNWWNSFIQTEVNYLQTVTSV